MQYFDKHFYLYRCDDLSEQEIEVRNFQSVLRNQILVDQCGCIADIICHTV